MSEWIRVKDRLPDGADEYLVWWAPVDKAKLFWYAPDRRQFGFWNNEKGGCVWIDTDEITHWMPLTEPPEDENEENDIK